MPVYNAGAFLKETIDSILCQTFADFELLALDDGSTDRSAEIIQSYNDTRDYSDRYVKGVLMDDGHIEWNADMIARQYGKATFENDMCIACKHLPICNGPCSQKIIETPPEKLESICSLNNSEVTPESFIIDLYEKKIKKIKELEFNLSE